MKRLATLVGFILLAGALPAWAQSGESANEHPGLQLPGQLVLHGRFDFSAERVGYSDNPLDGNAAFRNYHHFLFLSRHSPNDPFGFNVELIDLTFYEASYRYKPQGKSWGLVIRGGKVVVPFGNEPLFHTAYGGRAGFDQQVLPAVWARHGVAGQLHIRVNELYFTDDLYFIAGHRLRDPEDVLNLQNDFSDSDFTHVAAGFRQGAGWGPFTLWYSGYYNELGFGRRVYLQALDVTVWRVPDIPVLEDFTLRAGILRYDVSGGTPGVVGGPGLDYYGFGDYLEIRYYALPWLYVQGRTGIRTSNNRRGVFIDDSRLDIDDSESHSLGVVGRWRGLSAALFHYWNLEEANEQDDDFLRLQVSYEF